MRFWLISSSWLNETTERRKLPSCIIQSASRLGHAILDSASIMRALQVRPDICSRGCEGPVPNRWRAWRESLQDGQIKGTLQERSELLRHSASQMRSRALYVLVMPCQCLRLCLLGRKRPGSYHHRPWSNCVCQDWVTFFHWCPDLSSCYLLQDFNCGRQNMMTWWNIMTKKNGENENDFAEGHAFWEGNQKSNARIPWVSH